jgi:hypothetical protein
MREIGSINTNPVFYTSKQLMLRQLQPQSSSTFILATHWLTEALQVLQVPQAQQDQSVLLVLVLMVQLVLLV